MFLGPGARHEKNLVLSRKLEVMLPHEELFVFYKEKDPRLGISLLSPCSITISVLFSGMAFLPGVSFSLLAESFQGALLPLTSFPQFLLLLSDTVFLSAQPPLALCLSHRAVWF